MRKIFDDVEFIERGDITIAVRWQRNELTRKTRVNVFGDDKETYEKDYVTFEYENIRVQYSCLAEEHTIWNKVNSICDIIDTEGTAGLTINNIAWSNI